jgi:hypothetical protein
MEANGADIEKCLTSLGIEKRHIMPTNVERRDRPELNQFQSEINIFPLAWFDSGADLESIPACSEGRFGVAQKSQFKCNFCSLTEQ